MATESEDPGLLTHNPEHAGTQTQVHVARPHPRRKRYELVINSRLGEPARILSHPIHTEREYLPRSASLLAPTIFGNRHVKKQARKRRLCCLVVSFSWANELMSESIVDDGKQVWCVSEARAELQVGPVRSREA